MFSNFSLLEESKAIIGVNNENQKLFNNQTFISLNEKRKKIESKYLSFLKKEQQDPINLLSYCIFNPLKIKKDPDTKFKIDKDKLNELFLISEDKRLHKEIYKTKLYELLNPYHLVVEKKYIKVKYISNEIKAKFVKDKEEIKERGYNISLNEFYDKNTNIYFGLAQNIGYKYKIKNKDLIKNAVENKELLVKLINESDNFDKKILLKPDFTLEELKLLIIFLYKVSFGVNELKTISLYYDYNVPIEGDQKTLEELYKKYGNDYELIIYISADY